jgi:hypothetical protein
MRHRDEEVPLGAQKHILSEAQTACNWGFEQTCSSCTNQTQSHFVSFGLQSPRASRSIATIAANPPLNQLYSPVEVSAAELPFHRTD